MREIKAILKDLTTGQPATAAQVTTVMDALMGGHLDPIAAGAFLTLQMRNGVDAAQLQAALDVMLRYATTLNIEDDHALDNCGTGGDGGASFNVSTTAAFVAAGAGHTVAKHGNRAVSSTCGSADLLEAAGVNLRCTPQDIQRCINEVGIGFMFAPVFHPAVKHAVPIRKSLGVRTLFNMLGPLANPAGVTCQLIGVFDEELTDLFAEVLANQGKRAFVVYGEDGADEISLTTRTKVADVADGKFHTSIFDPRRHGFNLCEPDAIAGGTLESNQAIFESVLRKAERGPARDMVILNAGFAMHTSQRYKDLDEAFQAARDAIDGGHAWRKVEALVEFSQQCSSPE